MTLVKGMRWAAVIAAAAGLLAWTPAARGQAVDAWWTNWAAGAAGEYWTNAANWTNSPGGSGMPANGHAYLTQTNASYTVFYNTAAPAISNLIVRNKDPNKTTLMISAAFAQQAGASNKLMAGAVVCVTNGGVWTYEGTNAVTDITESMFCIRDGGELDINGGSVLFTNLENVAASTVRSYLHVGYASTGTLRMTAGQLVHKGNNYATIYVGNQSGGQGVMDVSGGTVALGVPSSGVSPLTVGNIATGTLTISSGGTVVITNAAGWNAVTIGYGLGSYGLMVVSNGGKFLVRNAGSVRMYVGSTRNARGILRIDGGLVDIFSGLYVGIPSGAGESATGLVEITAGTLMGSGLNSWIGYGSASGTGCGTLNVFGGTVTNFYLWIGYAINGYNGVGRLNVTNGLLTVTGNIDASQFGYPPVNCVPIDGLSIGYVEYDKSNALSRASGYATVSGGAITNKGTFVIGCNGGATGTLIQTGGAICNLPLASGWATTMYTMIGYGLGTNTFFGAGDGTYEMYGGTFTSPKMVFVGGVPTNTLTYYRGTATNMWYSLPGAVGRLKVAGGAFTVSNTVCVGGYGTGTVTIGSNGTVWCGNLVLSNNPSSKLRFEVGTSGTVGQLVVTNKLTIASGSKLEVYVPRSYIPDAPVKVLTLATYATNEGAFANPADITVSNYPGATVVQTTTNIQVRIPSRQGTMLIVR